MQVENGTCFMTYNQNAEASIARKFVIVRTDNCVHMFMQFITTDLHSYQLPIYHTRRTRRAEAAAKLIVPRKKSDKTLKVITADTTVE